ncbi:hypothetical protein [Caldimonas brevitalea]|uniref:Uncharacterized protein n=1 Tax=Caldimonas brevitalea TaxID=413882 RepID=A0A0G3BHD1_9BURK|nr:hypothetical protein [Caldimonas brevitalea]AKJ28829.1 hypothetical protein AAW51_2138 [Caldimonas brevitalea]
MKYKPRIRRTDNGWSCIGLGKEGNGRTPRGAYFDWLNEASFYPYF